MELAVTEFLSGLLAIVLLDLVLAGDNAIVIALAARRLPRQIQKKAVLWGTVGAIAVRLLLTGIVVYLLKLPGLMLVRRPGHLRQIRLEFGRHRRAFGHRQRHLLLAISRPTKAPPRDSGRAARMVTGCRMRA